MQLPDIISDENQLDEILSAPSPALVTLMHRLEGDIIILGITGKMGGALGTLAVEAIRQAGVRKRVIGVSRFTEPGSQRRFAAGGLETIRVDLLDRRGIAKLPRVKNVIYMAGRKFGTQDSEDLTWAMNVLAPANVSEHFAGSCIVAFSTGCVYPLVKDDSGGCTEQTSPAPVGDYAQSCLGRERIFSYFSRLQQTPVCLFRLNYAVDLRYGVLHDIGQRVLSGQPVDVSVGHFNVIWQGDANERALLALELCVAPPAVLNVTGPEQLSTRAVAEELGRLMGQPVVFSGRESDANYLSNAAKSIELFGPLRISATRLIRWQAHWLISGGRTLNKPTHFEVINGKY